jgi:tRNA-dihydrouridine synthase B
MKISDLDLGQGVFLAPIAGYTDIGFRYLARKYGADLTYTEMVSAKGINYNNKNTTCLLEIADNEKPSAVQLFGSEPEAFSKVIDSGALEKFDIIDINMGCPVRKIVGNGEGSALMLNPTLAQEIIRTLKRSRKIVTAKFRSGFDNVTAPEFAIALEDAGADAVTVHARTREQFYSGEADWSVIAAVKRAINIPVIGNGDIKCYADISRIKEETGCDGVMIARAALGNPYIFSNAATDNPYNDILIHIEYLLKLYTPRIVSGLMKKHVCFYGKFRPHLKAIRTDINNCAELDEVYSVVEKYFRE